MDNKTKPRDFMTLYLTDSKVKEILDEYDKGNHKPLDKLAALSKKHQVDNEDPETSDEYIDQINTLLNALIDRQDFASYRKIIESNHDNVYYFSCSDDVECSLNYAIIKNSPIMMDIIKLGCHHDFSPNGGNDCAIATAIDYGNLEAFIAMEDIAVREEGRLATSNYFTPLQHACFVGSYEFVKTIISRYSDNIDIEGTQCERTTALGLAVMNGNFDIIKLLVEAGANVNAIDEHGIRIMDLSPSADITAYLKDNGAKESEADTLLFCSITLDLENGNVGTAESDYARFCEEFNVLDYDTEGLLKRAIQCKSSVITKDLISRMDDLTCITGYEFMKACKPLENEKREPQATIDILRILIDSGVTVDYTGYFSIGISSISESTRDIESIELCNELFGIATGLGMLKDPENIMKNAVNTANLKLVKYIEEKTSYSIVQFEHEYGVAKHLFAYANANVELSKKIEFFKKLIEFHGDDISINRQDDFGETILHYMCSPLHLDRSSQIKGIIELGADKTIKNIYGELPVDVAHKNGRTLAEIELLEIKL